MARHVEEQGAQAARARRRQVLEVGEPGDHRRPEHEPRPAPPPAPPTGRATARSGAERDGGSPGAAEPGPGLLDRSLGESFSVAIEPTPAGAEGRCGRVRLRGELDLAATDRLRDVLIGLPTGSVVVDLSELTFVDASGLSALLIARREITSAGGRFSLVGARGFVRRVFAVADLGHFLDD